MAKTDTIKIIKPPAFEHPPWGPDGHWPSLGYADEQLGKRVYICTVGDVKVTIWWRSKTTYSVQVYKKVTHNGAVSWQAQETHRRTADDLIQAAGMVHHLINNEGNW